MTVKKMATVEELIAAVRSDYRQWNTKSFPWFRGEPLAITTPLLPALFRGPHDENRLLQQFRQKAPSLGLGVIPHRDHTDQWLFLARHVGLPTRLLDWTEGLLIALLFAVIDGKGEPRAEKDGATVWMLDPVELNRQSSPFNPSRDNEFPLTWLNAPTERPTREELLSWVIATVEEPADTVKYPDRASYLKAIRNSMLPNIGAMNVRRAWGDPGAGTDLPVAVHGTSIHPRITAQKGCFTIHGKIQKPLSDIVPDRILRQYHIQGPLNSIRTDLRMIGITYATMFPDLDGLATDLRSWF